MGRLDGRTAIVTGASGGIGLATARLFHAEGARLVLNARRADRLQAAAQETGAESVCGDITDAAVRTNLVQAAGGRVDILVNNAGYGQPGPCEAVPIEEARRQMEVNFFAAAEMARAVLPAMRGARSGRILNVSSIADRFGYPLFGWYCASKHALEGWSDALRLELAPFGIRVVLIEPGPVRTEFFEVARARGDALLSDKESPYRDFYAAVDDIEADMMKQAGEPEGVARVLLKAACKRRPRARYAVTGMAKMMSVLLRVLPRSWLDAAVNRQFQVPKRVPPEE